MLISHQLHQGSRIPQIHIILHKHLEMHCPLTTVGIKYDCHVVSYLYLLLTYLGICLLFMMQFKGLCQDPNTS